MFTGLIRDCGVVETVSDGPDGRRLRIATRLSDELRTGDSLSVNGVCLTAESLSSSQVVATVVPETLERSTLGELKPRDRVHLEPALRAGDALGGHLVQGHVDETGRVVGNGRAGAAWMLEIEASAALMRYIVEKGSVALDGVSLTVAACTDGGFSVALVPHTREVTLLGDRRAGQRVNIEVDILAKYVERLLAPRLDSARGVPAAEALTEARLKELGY